MSQITTDDFKKIDIRVGTVVNVKEFAKAKIPAYKLLIDLGEEIGTRQSCAQITDLYKKEDLIGKQVVCVVNFPPKQVADFSSEVLVTGFVDKKNRVVLAMPDQDVENGLKLM